MKQNFLLKHHLKWYGKSRLPKTLPVIQMTKNKWSTQSLIISSLSLPFLTLSLCKRSNRNRNAYGCSAFLTTLFHRQIIDYVADIICSAKLQQLLYLINHLQRQCHWKVQGYRGHPLVSSLFYVSTVFSKVDLLRYYNYEKDYIDDSTTDNTTCLMRIYA